MSRTVTIIRRMYDPETGRSWLQAFDLRANSKAELKAEFAKLNALYPKWTGSTADE